MAARATGTVQWVKEATGGYWRARLRLNDGSRPWIRLGPEYTEGMRDAAKAHALALNDRARQIHAVRLPKHPVDVLRGETTRAWFGRWWLTRESHSSLYDDKNRYKNHIDPYLGKVAMAAVTREDLERVVAALDLKIVEGTLSWRTAGHVWGLVTKAFSDATNAKDAALRVRKDNPAAMTHGPERGEKKSKVYLYPSEFTSLVSCEAVPLRWRQIYSLSVYLATRAGELEVLRWDDVDLEHRVVFVHKAIDRRAKGAEKGKTKSTKTGVTRRVSIEPELAPLLVAMRGEATQGTELVVKVPPVEDLAACLREHLGRAGVTRAELFANDAARKNMTFHDLRATGLTWMAVRGDAPLSIQDRAGHMSFATTQGYIREAGAMRVGFGEVFPPLPPTLFGSDQSLIGLSGFGVSSKPLENRRNAGRPQRDLNPLHGVYFGLNTPQSPAIREVSVPIAARRGPSRGKKDQSETNGEIGARAINATAVDSIEVDHVAAALLERRHLAVTISHLVTRLLEQGLDAQADRAMQLLSELRSAPPPTVRKVAADEEGTG